MIVHVFKTDFYGALKILSDFDDILFQTSLKDTPSVLTDEKVPKEDVFLLENVQPFSNQNTSLHHYIVTERCIDVKTISPFLKTVFFKHLPTGKSFVAAGIENTEGGMKFAIHFLKGLYLKVIKVFLGFRQHTTMNELLVLKDLWIFYPTALFSVGVRKLSYIKFDRIFKKSH